MSEYQYYEFCSINTPLSAKGRKEMMSLSSRAKVGTHNAFYVYNYGDFRGDVKQLILEYFDVFFYISNFGTVRLFFKYPVHQIHIEEIKKYCIKHVITIAIHGEDILLEIDINNEEGFGWTEGEGILPDLLPLYDEIKSGNYQILRLVHSINEVLTGQEIQISAMFSKNMVLSEAQEAFLECACVNV